MSSLCNVSSYIGYDSFEHDLREVLWPCAGLSDVKLQFPLIGRVTKILKQATFTLRIAIMCISKLLFIILKLSEALSRKALIIATTASVHMLTPIIRYHHHHQFINTHVKRTCLQ